MKIRTPIWPTLAELANTKLIEEQWDDILRLVVSFKLYGNPIPSFLLQKLTSPLHTDPLILALKEFGKIHQTLFILTFNNEEALKKRIIYLFETMHENFNVLNSCNDRLNNSTINKKSMYHPISMLPLVAEAINGSFENTNDLIKTFSEQEDKHGSLNDDELARAKKIFKEGLEFVPNFREQLQRWEKTDLNSLQKIQVAELINTNNSLTKLYADGIALIKRLSPYTIDKIMAMDPAELAVKVLAGEINSPRA